MERKDWQERKRKETKEGQLPRLRRKVRLRASVLDLSGKVGHFLFKLRPDLFLLPDLLLYLFPLHTEALDIILKLVIVSLQHRTS